MNTGLPHIRDDDDDDAPPSHPAGGPIDVTRPLGSAPSPLDVTTVGAAPRAPAPTSLLITSRAGSPAASATRLDITTVHADASRSASPTVTPGASATRLDITTVHADASRSAGAVSLEIPTVTTPDLAGTARPVGVPLDVTTVSTPDLAGTARPVGVPLDVTTVRGAPDSVSFRIDPLVRSVAERAAATARDALPPTTPPLDATAATAATMRAGVLSESALDVTAATSLPPTTPPLDVTTATAATMHAGVLGESALDVTLATSRDAAPPTARPLDVTTATAATMRAGALSESALEVTAATHPGGDTVLSGGPGPTTAFDADALPRQIGRYPVLRRLGSGGMGTVFAAFDEALARRIAVKMLHVGLHLPPGVRAPIVAEAQAMARLSHANVVQVYELGEHEGGLFLAMEYVEGRTLTDWLKEQERSWPEIVRIFLAAGEGVAAAHRAGIIHGDFKPDNVLVDRDEVPRVADFGLARVASEDPTLVAGTPAYMAPEQLLGAPSDARTDQFSLCVALYAALYGQPPFAGDTLADLTASVTKGALRPPPRSGVPAGLHAALSVGLATDPARRHPSIDVLLAALREHLPDQRRSSRAWLAAPLLAAAALGAFVWTRGGPSGPTLADMGLIGRHAIAVLSAGQRAEWVYPDERSDPKATAIRGLVALEHLPGPAGDYARTRADGLRALFAGDLAALGDRYWDDEKTRPFARDFYAQTLMFRPDHELALRRSRLTVGQLSDLRERAEETSFTPEQLEAAAPLRILAHTTDPAVIAALVAARDQCSEPVPASIAGAGGPGHVAPDPTPEAPSEPVPEPQTEPAPTPEPTPAPATTPAPAHAPTPDTSALIEEAENARRTGQDTRAETLFRKALALDPREAVALAGLSDIAFDRGDFAEAAGLATRAIRLAPEIAEHHTRLGDAKFKLDKIAEARKQYERAIALGDPRAQRRLDLIDRPAPESP